MKTLSRRILLSLIPVFLAVAFCLGISAKELDVGIPVEEYPGLFMGQTMPTHGEGKIAVFLIQFPDYRNDNPDATAEYYNQLYFSAEPLDGTKADNPWYGSVATFYREQSYGKLNLSGQVFDWYTAKHERAYYNDDQKKKELVLEAVAYYEAKGVDFGRFDGDGNGELDAVIYHFAGPADERLEEPWYDGLKRTTYVGKTGTGQKINSFIQLGTLVDRATKNSENMRRIACHELLHTLGMYDLYGTGWYPTLAPAEDLMCNNTFTINPYYKILLGWTNKVTLVTSDTLDIQLNVWETSGETILVTDQYNGIFDEFYLIAYARDQAFGKTQIRIWHVDARLNADKTAFLYDNLTYSPKPGQESPHVTVREFSEQLFIEEVSAIPYSDHVLNWTNSLYFREGSSLGPGSIPSTDTHDGKYTGIKIDDFKGFGTHATMDITFGNQDTAAPEISDKQSVIGFKAENKLIFNEYIYPSANWDKIQITTLTGETIPARITHGYYARYEIEIIIEGEIPKEGYQIVLPEDCVRDSSGNRNKAATIPVTTNGKIFEQFSVLIPWYYPDKTRFWEQPIHSFSYGNENILITVTGEGDNMGAFIEFIKVGADGEMTTHKFIRNPYEGRCELYRVYRANDGSCILRFRDLSDMNTILICVDPNGELRWHKRSKERMEFGHLTDAVVAYENGILFCGQWRTFIDAQTGEITDTNVRGKNLITACYNGTDVIGISATIPISILVMDPVTLRVKETHGFDVQWNSGYYQIKMVYNSNGTYTFVVFGRQSAGITAAILDSSFRVVKQTVFDGVADDSNALSRQFSLNLYPDDGFVAVVCTAVGNHSNGSYHVFRASRSLDLMWETDIETNYTGFFVTASNEICAFSSDWSPKRLAYLQKYGSEDAFEVISHTMTHRAARAATCIAEGQIEHWFCSDCGGYFVDADGKNATTASAVILPKAAHVPAPYADVAPTCTANGSTGGTYCKTCTWELTLKTVIPATGHTAVEDPAVAPTEESEGLTAGSHCSVCAAVISAQKPIPRLEPVTTAAPATTEALATTEAPVTTETPVTTEAPATSEAPETTVIPAATVVAETTAGPMTTNSADETNENAGVTKNVMLIIGISAAAVVIVVGGVIVKKRKSVSTQII